MSSGKPGRRKNSDGGIAAWIFIILLLNLLPPLGLLFLILKLTGHDVLGNFFNNVLGSANGKSNSNSSSANRGGAAYVPNSSSRSRGTAVNPVGPEQIRWDQLQNENTAKPEEEQPGEQPASAPSGLSHPETEKVDRNRKTLLVFGWILAVGGALLSVKSLVNFTTLWALVRALAVLLGGGCMLLSARSKLKKARMYENCVAIVGDRAYISVDELAASAGVPRKAFENSLEEMLKRNYFGERAYWDKAGDYLILDAELAKEQLEKVRQNVPPTPEASTVGTDATGDRYTLLLNELDRAAGRITDREMLEKTVQIRGLTAAIFHAVREEPQKEQKITSFVNYYFPTTLKLLDSYADFESKGYQSDSISKSRERISDAADSIISAYQKQLDQLYLSDTMDVDTDIDVLETMLRRDGLGETDFKPQEAPSEGTTFPGL